MFKMVLVPLDGSILAEQALAPADRLARRTGAQVLLVQAPNMEPAYAAVESAYGWTYPEHAFGQASAEAANYLRSIQSRQGTHGLAVNTVIAGGDAAGAILDVASQAKADIIIMSSHGYSGLTRWLLGSITEKVLRGAKCPVLVVRSQWPFKHMLITLDGSELSESSVAPAGQMALAHDARVTLLRVVPEIRAEQSQALDDFEAGLGPRLVSDMREEAETYLQKVASRLLDPSLKIDFEVRAGPAAKAILEYAESKQVDLIAMATHGRGGLPRWVYGSVTEKVLHAAIYSMLVVRPEIDRLN
jgi:nucleotide-binding universal stress UspA family protein